ncbi:hypothetical protein [Bacteroides fragilis]|uniref:hypothetical protein n=1 Tax=Bacteroides fragilis TaxID=817 RepID=UPI000446755C|nr:hypothetical protein [Bacteroides fragilis]EXY83571.1 hypothetical protein M079_3231 [Bacteroides fragilis str. 3996 N(B) 6]
MKMNMNAIIKSKVLLFLVALAIPTVVFLIMAYMMSFLLKGNVVLSPFICIIIVTYLLIASAEHINKKVDSALGKSIGILIGTEILFYFFFLEADKNDYKTIVNELIVILFIYGWALSVFMWAYNLFKKQKDIANTDNINNATNDNDDLIGGWYGVDSNLSCWLPVLAFEKNYIATFSDGKIVKEYSYHICCSTCIILTAKDGEKIFVKRIWVKGKPHLFYNEQTFTQDGKHSE